MRTNSLQVWCLILLSVTVGAVIGLMVPAEATADTAAFETCFEKSGCAFTSAAPMAVSLANVPAPTPLPRGLRIERR